MTYNCSITNNGPKMDHKSHLVAKYATQPNFRDWGPCATYAPWFNPNSWWPFFLGVKLQGRIVMGGRTPRTWQKGAAGKDKPLVAENLTPDNGPTLTCYCSLHACCNGCDLLAIQMWGCWHTHLGQSHLLSVTSGGRFARNWFLSKATCYCYKIYGWACCVKYIGIDGLAT